MVDLVRSGRDPADLARGYEPTAQSIRPWVAGAGGRTGSREQEPASADADELLRLRRERRQLRQERVADITFIPTAAGFLYLAVVLDAWSRKIVGWAMANPPRAPSWSSMRPTRPWREPPAARCHPPRADQGSQCTSLDFGGRCREAGVRPSMGPVGDAHDNAMCESFFATPNCELRARRRFASQAEARMAVFRSVEGGSQPAPAARRPRRPVPHRPRAAEQSTTKAGQLQLRS